MARLGDYIEQVDEKNVDEHLTLDSVRGVSIKKCFIPTKANMDGVSLKSYKIVKPMQVCYVPVTSRNGNKITIALNTSTEEYLVSGTYIVFKVKNEKELLPLFLDVLFKCSEFDRLSRFNSWGSARETLSFDDLCLFEIPIPSIEVQQRIVDIYSGLNGIAIRSNQMLAPLKESCNALLAKIANEYERVPLGEYIEECNERNAEGLYGADDVRGLATSKEIIETKANMTGVSVTSYKLLHPLQFAYVADTSRRGDKVSMGYNSRQETYLVSSISTVFQCMDRTKLNPDYLFLLFKRPEFDRCARYNSWGSARETYTFADLCRLHIPLPPIEVQESIAELMKGMDALNDESKRATELLRDLCPALVQLARHFE